MTKPMTARHDLTIWRNDDYYEYPIRVVGLDLTDIALAMEVRRGGDVSGPPEIALAKITNGENGATFETQGLHVRGISIVDGVEVSDVRIRMDRPNLQALPYDGERGDAATFEYALVIGGRTRLRGNVILPAHAYRSDAAPAAREPSYSSGYARQASSPDSGASLTISQDGGATLQIDGADMVSGAVVRAESARDEAVAAADDTVAALDSLGQDAFNYVGRPANAVLVNGTPKGVGSVFWHDAVGVAGYLTAVDVFDRSAGRVNVAVYRGPLNALERPALGSFATTGAGTSRRIALAAPLPVRVGDILAIQPDDGVLTVAEVQSGDIGYTYGAPFLPENVSLGAPTTNGQLQVRFVITYRQQIVTADNFLALSEIRVIGARARALSSASNPAGYVAWTTTGAPTGHTVTWGSYTAKLGPLADRMEFPQWSVSKPLFVAGNSLSTSTDVVDRYSQVLAARYGQPLVSIARYSSDERMVYRSGAAPINLTLAGALPAGGSVAVTQINGAPIDGNNPAAFLTTGDPAVITGMSMTGYATRNGVERKVTVSAPNGASFNYSVTQAPGQTAIEFDGPVLFTPEASLSIRGSTCIVWLGNNFFYSEVPNQYGDYTNPKMWVDLKLIVTFLQSQGCQVLLLPVIPSSLPNWVEGIGTPLTAMRAANTRTETLFPGLMGRHADGRDLIKFLQDRKDGSPDAQADVNKGWIPRNLHRAGDTLHLNADGDLAVADFVDSALRSQVGPPAITPATTFTITAEGSQAGPDATAGVRVERDQLASLADAVDGVVQDAVYRPTIAAAVADLDVGTFFVSRDLDGLTAHTGVKWQYKVTADAPHFSDEGAWSDTTAAALGLDAYVGTTPARLPVSTEQAAAIASSTDALAQLTGYALDRRVRTDAAQVLTDAEKSTALGNMGAAATSEVEKVAATASNAKKGINVFEALSNGGSDIANADQINAALLLSRDHGVPAYLPGGTTAVLSNGKNILMVDGSSLAGDGVSSVVTTDYSTGSIPNCLVKDDWYNPTKDVSIRSLKFDRSGGFAQHVMLFNGVENLAIDDIEIEGVPSVGSGLICVSGIMTSTNIPTRLLSRNVSITNSILGDCANFGVQLGYVAGAIVANNLFPRAYREVIGIEPEAGCTADNVLVIGNEIECLIADAIANNLGSQTGAIVVTMTSGAAAIRNSVVAHNAVRFSDSVPGSFMPGIGVFGDMDIDVIGNTVRGASGPGFQMGNLLGIGKTLHGRFIDNQALDCNQGGNADGLGAGFNVRGGSYNVFRGNKAKGALHTASYWEDNNANFNSLTLNDWLDTVRTKGLGAATSSLELPNALQGAMRHGHSNASSTSFTLEGSAAANPFLAFARNGKDIFRLRSNNANGDIELNLRNDDESNLGTAITLLRGAVGARAVSLMLGNVPTGFWGATPTGKKTLPVALDGSATLTQVIAAFNNLRLQLIATTLVG